ncbi:unnamed protein product [Trichobilharzia regenti]|nr:unnamed protein product [Trichobilharzia regenti]
MVFHVLRLIPVNRFFLKNVISLFLPLTKSKSMVVMPIRSVPN